MSPFKRLCPFLAAWFLAGWMSLLPGFTAGQVRVTHLTSREGATGRRGLIYALPRTVLLIDLKITRTDQIPGPYAQYAAELLGIGDAISAQRTSYVLDEAAIFAASEADPEQIYLVEMDEKASEDIFYALSPSGLIIGSEGFYNEDGARYDDRKDFFSRIFTTDDIFPDYRTRDMKENTDTITRIVTFDTLTYTEKILKRYMVKQSDKEKSQEAASLINSIGQDEYTLLVGYQETAYSGEALKFMIDQLEQQRRSYLRLFTGVTRTEQVHLTLRYTPGSDLSSEPVILSGFSPVLGLTDPEGSDDITLSVVKNGMTEVIGNDTASPGFPAGYCFRVPETCEVTVKFQEVPLGKKVLPVNQLGIIRCLPPSVTQVEFYPETGAIKRVILK